MHTNQPVYYQHPYPPVYTYPVQVQPQMYRAVTRPPFPHGKHLKWCVLTGGIWTLGYGIAYLVHRVGPTKAVTRFQYR